MKKTFWYEDFETGENFFVKAETESEANDIAVELFNNSMIRCLGEVDDLTAESILWF